LLSPLVAAAVGTSATVQPVRATIGTMDECAAALQEVVAAARGSDVHWPAFPFHQDER
jgi:hypothetical protein